MAQESEIVGTNEFLQGGYRFPWVVVVLSIILSAVAFPPFNFGEAAFFFATPFLIWACRAKRVGLVFKVAFGIAFVFWLITIVWLRNVSWVAYIALAGFLSIFMGTWFFVAGNFMRKIFKFSGSQRLLGIFALSAFWVVLEWVRSFIFTGFLWLPLAATQWQTPTLLQIADKVGSYGVSFGLVFFNLAIASYAAGIFANMQVDERKVSNRHRMDLFLGLVVILGLFSPYMRNNPSVDARSPIFGAGIVQPYVKPTLKWDQDHFRENLMVLKEESLKLQDSNADVILWPETALPQPITGKTMSRWVESVCNELGKPIWLGSVDGNDRDEWFNSIFIVNPNLGIAEEHYSKRKRVPFGEYVPLRKFFPFVNKFIPVEFDITPGEGPQLLNVALLGKPYKLGGLVCYEDIFPQLSRESTKAGADFFVVMTNNAWHDEASAYQHAAHSVLRAVETRRPFVRCGNGGWSGWIDEYGVIRKTVEKDGTVYFRGVDEFEVYRDKRWIGVISPYVQYGDRFAYICLALSLLGLSLFLNRNNEVSI